jgi:hypothetical protein
MDDEIAKKQLEVDRLNALEKFRTLLASENPFDREFA